MTQDTPRIAVLIANGFDEITYTTLQKVMVKQGFTTQVVSSENAVVNGWTGQGWGCFFPVDAPINQTLAADFNGLIIPGGSRAIEKLMKTAHTRRIFESFVSSEKPVLICGKEELYDELMSNLTVTEKEALFKATEATAESLQKACSEFIAKLSESSYDMNEAA